MEAVDHRCRGIYNSSDPNLPLRPGARCCGHVFHDPSSDTTYMWGGFGYDATGTQGYLTDLWSFSNTNGTFRFIGGSQTGDTGTSAARAGSDWPAGRMYAAYAFDAKSRSFWVSSGEGPNNTYLPDVWRLDVDAMAWEHVGDFREPAPRTWANSWAGSDGMWLFAGVDATSEQLNDMWFWNYSTLAWRRVYNREGNP